MPSCVLRKCKNYGVKKNKSLEVSYHKFPIDEFIKNKWVSIVKAERSEPDWMPSKGSTICSAHFKEEDKYFTPKGLKRLNKTAVPMIAQEPEYSGDVFEPGTSYSSVEPLGSGYVDDPGTLSSSASEVSTNGNEIKVFCPKCNTEVSHTAEGIQQDQTKILIAKVYRYFEQEYEELKLIYGDMDLTPLSKVCERTALATGVSEAMLMQILKEEERRNEERQWEEEGKQEPPQKERAARKRRRQTTHSSEEDSSDDNVEDIEQPSAPDETLVVKIELPESNNDEPEIFMEPSDGDTNKEHTDPISLDLKSEQQDDDDDLDNTDATPAPETSADTKRKAKKIPRLGDVTSLQQHTQAECSTSAASRSKRRETEESSLPGKVEITTEGDEEGFS